MWLWKCLTSEMCSNMGDESPWELGVWKKHDGPVEVYSSGFHASKNIIDAMRNMPEVGFICLVEAQGEHDQLFDDIEAWSKMRVLRAWEWTKADSVALAVFAAELVIDIFEKAFPDDNRACKAIKAAKTWLSSSIEKNRQEAEKAAEEANEAAWMVASKDDKKYEGAFEAVLAARDAARAAANEELAVKFALDAERAAELALAKVLAADETLELWDKIRNEIKSKCHSFVYGELKEKERR